MKRKVLGTLTLLLVCTLAAFGFTACGNSGNGGVDHLHCYDEIVSPEYLKSAATCESAAVYYKSCSECGIKGNGTFEYGTALGHSYENGVCTECGGKENGSGGGETHEHTYVEKVDSKHLKSEATCESPAIYYKSCSECDAHGEDTFEYGSALGHAYGDWVSNGDGTHSKTCANDSSHKITENCHGGSATCREKAICTDCGGGYGSLKEHTYSDEWSFNGTHHWKAATCGCTLKKDYAEHTFSDSLLCDACGESVTATEGVLYDLSSDGTYAEVIGYTGTATKVKIADTYNGLPVKTIYDSAFKQTKITYIVIPESVTSIGERAFYYCRSLTSIEIPAGVTSIGGYAFYECDSLTSIEIPAGVTGIGEWAFYGCSSLRSVTFGENSALTSIGRYAFYYCSSLTSIEIPAGVTSIGSYAFKSCYNLQYTIYGNVKYLGNEDNPYLALITPVTNNLSSFTIHANTKVIANYAFYECSRLTSVTFGENSALTSIGSWAFEGCSSLTSIEIPAGVTSIGECAFLGCRSLTSIEIPDSVTSIGDQAFGWCYRLVEVYNRSSLTIEAGSRDNGSVGYYALKVYTNGETSSKLTEDGNGYLIYTEGEEKILIAYHGTGTDLVLPSGITKINQFAFYYCSSLVSIEIPAGVTSIGDYAFSECGSLTSIEIPAGVTSIGDYAFSECGSLTSIEIPDSVTSIGWCAFEDCSSLRSIYYTGTKEDWDKISIDDYNSALTSATRYYYRESKPSESGNYWHYDDNGEIAVW